MKDKTIEKLVFGIFFGIGIAVMCIGIGIMANSIRVSGKAVATTATISSIETYRDSDNEIRHNVFISYDAEGQRFENVTLGEYSSGMYEGKTIEIKYVPGNPGKPYSNGILWLAPVIVIALGLIFGTVGGIGLGVQLGKDRKKYTLLNSGKCLHATVESISLNTGYSVNGRHPFVIFCSYRDEYENTVYRFKSGHVWDDPQYTMPVGSLIDVYVNPQDYSKYYVDTETVYGDGARVVDYT